MATSKIKKGDTVRIITGKDINNEGKVISVDHKNHKVVVEGQNMVTKHTKPSAANANGGIMQKEAPIDASNVMLYDKKAKSVSRVGYKLTDGKKTRVFKKSGAEIKEAKK